MAQSYSTKLFRKVLVPMVHGADSKPALSLALMIAETAHVALVGIVGISEQDSACVGRHAGCRCGQFSAFASPTSHGARSSAQLATSNPTSLYLVSQNCHASIQRWRKPCTALPAT